ncbi:MAG: ATP-binding protein [Deltaproteobacteria bacterium]|nr:ATP-binding protein [Deltaproteobacteria bacterium]
MRARLDKKLAPAVVVRGPRQVGKTIAQLQLLDDLLSQGLPASSILRVQCDELPGLLSLQEPILRIVDWYESKILGESVNARARSGQPTFIFLDEVQNLADWAPQVKFLVDTTAVQVVITGSSALRIEQGRDSLAGRISTIVAGTLSLTEIGGFRGIDVGVPHLPDNGPGPLVDKTLWAELAGPVAPELRQGFAEVFRLFSQRGGYPLVHQRHEVDFGQLADQLNETVIRRVIQHDLRVGERGRKRDQSLLEELFRLSCRYIGQSPGSTALAREVQRVVQADVGPQRVQHYLRFLNDTLLLRVVEPLEIRLKRRRGNAKLCLADHGLRASWLQESIPIDPDGLDANPHLTELAGRISESVVGALLTSIPGLDVAHLPARHAQPEVDYVLTIGTRRIPLEVKYQKRIDPWRDTEGLRTFIETAANNAPFGILITRPDAVGEIEDPRIVRVPLPNLLLMR